MFDERNKTCFFTGHRSVPNGSASEVVNILDRIIESLYYRGFSEFICGGAIGFDTLAACRVAVAKKKFGSIKLRLILPCRDQTFKWRNNYDIELYRRIKGMADDVTYASENYTSGCMHLRNRMMADRSSVCVAYYNGSSSGGTAYTVKYARELCLEIINVYELYEKQKKLEENCDF